jgi:hypothetical protein
MDLTHTAQLLEIIGGSTEPEQRRWYDSLAFHLAEGMVLLSHQYHHLDSAAQKVYPGALKEALSLLPRGVRVNILPNTHESIGYLTDVDHELSELAEQHLAIIEPFSTSPYHAETAGSRPH